ncbi:MAG: hypothetical protein IT437_10190 [Phycisphaerales bacterium]|nr:hypothetical protein [Phycisphaerales bacterium]
MSGQSPGWTPAARWAMAVALLGWAAGAAEFVLAPHVFLRGYLAAFVFWCGVPLGSGAILMLYYLVGGRWGQALRPLLECGAATIPILAILFIPVILGLWSLYPWADAARVAQSEALRHKAVYLNPAFFIVRAAAFFLIWCIGAWALVPRSRRAASGGPAPAALSAAGLIVYGLTVSLAAVDWIASLEPVWYSSVFGMYVMIGQALTALALAILGIVWLAPRHADPAAVVGVLHDLGNLLLTFVILHAYLAYVQFLIIWNGNLPHQDSWYLPRSHGVWGAVSLLLILIHFALPFCALLFRRVKRNPRPMAAVAILILAAQAVEAVWMVVPSSAGPALAAVAPAVALIAGIGGLWLVLAARLWRRRPVPPQPVQEQAP